ncbi:MAG TPA: hypothetical protein VFF29_02300 [Bacteroidota bacterium]|nr:hypothetical protein [Bacteroidota bacterium]
MKNDLGVFDDNKTAGAPPFSLMKFQHILLFTYPSLPYHCRFNVPETRHGNFKYHRSQVCCVSLH